MAPFCEEGGGCRPLTPSFSSYAKQGGDLQHFLLPVLQERLLADSQEPRPCWCRHRRHGLRRLHHEAGKLTAMSYDGPGVCSGPENLNQRSRRPRLYSLRRAVKVGALAKPSPTTI